MEEKADPRPSITCPPPSALAQPFLEWRLIIVITDLHIISSICCTSKDILHAEGIQELVINESSQLERILAVIKDMYCAITVTLTVLPVKHKPRNPAGCDGAGESRWRKTEQHKMAAGEGIEADMETLGGGGTRTIIQKNTFQLHVS